MFVKSDLVEKFNWPEMSPHEVEFPPRNAETSTSNDLVYHFKASKEVRSTHCSSYWPSVRGVKMM